MLAKKITDLEEYLSYSYSVLAEHHILQKYPTISKYYEELCQCFKSSLIQENDNYFIQLGQLLAIDAQIQILMSLTPYIIENLMIELHMSEKEIIQMVQDDKNVFYRELTGISISEEPPWGLIYLSEVVSD